MGFLNYTEMEYINNKPQPINYILMLAVILRKRHKY